MRVIFGVEIACVYNVMLHCIMSGVLSSLAEPDKKERTPTQEI